MKFLKQWWRWLIKTDNQEYGMIIPLYTILLFVILGLSFFVGAVVQSDVRRAQWDIEQQCYKVPGETFKYNKTSGKSKGVRTIVTYHCKDGFYQREKRYYP